MPSPYAAINPLNAAVNRRINRVQNNATSTMDPRGSAGIYSRGANIYGGGRNSPTPASSPYQRPGQTGPYTRPQGQPSRLDEISRVGGGVPQPGNPNAGQQPQIQQFQAGSFATLPSPIRRTAFGGWGTGHGTSAGDTSHIPGNTPPPASNNPTGGGGSSSGGGGAAPGTPGNQGGSVSAPVQAPIAPAAPFTPPINATEAAIQNDLQTQIGVQEANREAEIADILATFAPIFRELDRQRDRGREQLGADFATRGMTFSGARVQSDADLLEQFGLQRGDLETQQSREQGAIRRAIAQRITELTGQIGQSQGRAADLAAQQAAAAAEREAQRIAQEEALQQITQDQTTAAAAAAGADTVILPPNPNRTPPPLPPSANIGGIRESPPSAADAAERITGTSPGVTNPEPRVTIVNGVPVLVGSPPPPLTTPAQRRTGPTNTFWGPGRRR